MQKIPKTFNKNGLSHELIKREGNIALYVQSFPEGGISGYEVHKIIISTPSIAKYEQPDGTFKEIKYPAKEKLASNEEFGRYGWSCLTLAQAETVFKQQVELSKQNGK
jgi:hypothetical protein